MKWSRQPPFPLRVVNFDGALIQPHLFNDSVTQHRPTFANTNTPGVVSREYGLARQLVRSSPTQDEYPVSGHTGDITVFLVGGLAGTGGYTQRVMSLVTSGGTERFWFGENSNDRMSIITTPSGGSTVSIQAGGSGADSAGEHVWVARLSGTSITLWRNGVQVASGTQAGNNFSDVTGFRVGSTAFLGGADGWVVSAGFERRAWSDEEIQDYSVNPFKLWPRKNRPSRFFDALEAAGGGITGSSTVALSGVNGSATASTSVSGTSIVSLQNIAVTASGSSQISGQSDTRFESLSGSASGASVLPTVTGNSSVGLSGLDVSGSGQSQVSGQSSIRLSDVFGSSTASSIVSASSAVGLSGLSAQASGQAGIAGQSAVALNNVAGSASGSVGQDTIIGNSSVTLAGVSGSSSGSVAISGASSIQLSGASGQAAASSLVSGASSQTFNNLSGSAQGTSNPGISGSSSVTLSGVSASGTASASINAQSSIALQGLTVNGSASSAIRADSSVFLQGVLALSALPVIPDAPTQAGSGGADEDEDLSPRAKKYLDDARKKAIGLRYGREDKKQLAKPEPRPVVSEPGKVAPIVESAPTESTADMANLGLTKKISGKAAEVEKKETVSVEATDVLDDDLEAALLMMHMDY